MDIQLTIHDQHAVGFVFCSLDIAVLVIGIRCVQVDQVAFLVCLVGFRQSFVLFECVIFAVYILQEGELGCPIVKFFFAQHSVLDEKFQAVPLFFELRTVVLEHFFQAICHLFHNVVGDLFHVLVAL